MFQQENTFFAVFAVFAGKYVLARNTFSVFAEICVLAGKHVLRFSLECVLQFWREMHFDEKKHFSVLAEKHVLWFWRKNVFLCFGGKMRFGVLA